MVALVVRNDEAVGSIPTSSTKDSVTYKPSTTKSCPTLSQKSGPPECCCLKLISLCETWLGRNGKINQCRSRNFSCGVGGLCICDARKLALPTC
jgi:hypothetical protein